MNKLILRLTWLSVKAAEFLIPILYRLAEFLFYSAIVLFVLFLIVIIL